MMQEPARRPRLLLVDSGVGGLSVAREIIRVVPQAALAYIADSGFFPYGTKPPQAVSDRVEALVAGAVDRLAPDLVVVACNTASIVALPALRRRLAMPVVGVVPAVKPAASLSRRRVIGLLGTPATVRGEYTSRLIEQFAAGCAVRPVGSAALVEIAERLLLGIAPDPAAVTAELAAFFTGPETSWPDVIVLGCTHFPLLRRFLEQAVPPGIAFVDSGAAIARRVEALLRSGTEADILAETPPPNPPPQAGEGSFGRVSGSRIWFTAAPPPGIAPALTELGFAPPSVWPSAAG